MFQSVKNKNGLQSAAGCFLDQPPLIIATGDNLSGTTMQNPVLAAGPAGETLIVYELDAGIDRCAIQARLLSSSQARPGERK